MRRVAVFIDWQNCYHLARLAFHKEDEPSRHGNVRPKAFAEMLVEKGDARDELVHVGIYRGEPNPRRDPQTHAAHMRMRQSWIDECGADLVRVRTRPLRYLMGRPLSDAEEKGIDVQLAIDAMVMGIQKDYDYAILATTDTDLLPVVEGLTALRMATGKPDVAVIGWAGTEQHLTAAATPVLWIGKRDYEVVRNRVDFNLSADMRRNPH
jgi:uncharacterized LabA/DUF88 family protein